MERDAAPIAVVGAGPVGLATAAHLHERGLPFVLLEAGDRPAAAIREWAHVRLFSPWSELIDQPSRRLLDETGWIAPDPTHHPTGRELVELYLEPLAAVPTLARHLRLGHRVIAVTRRGADTLSSSGRDRRPFELAVDTPHGMARLHASSVVDASGTWSSPNPAGSSGVPASGEAGLDRIAYRVPDATGADRDRYAGRTTMVIGAGHSAFNSLLALTALAADTPDTNVVWAIRGAATSSLVDSADDRLTRRGELGNRVRQLLDTRAVSLVEDVRTTAFESTMDGRVVVVGEDAAGAQRRLAPVDEVVVNTGFRPDLSMTAELRLDLDPVVETTRALAPLIDPNVHSCGTVPPHGVAELTHVAEPGFHVVGMKSYGRAPTFLLLTGYEQVRSVVAALAGDHEAARRVELVLPAAGTSPARTTEERPGTTPAHHPIAPPVGSDGSGRERPTSDDRVGHDDVPRVLSVEQQADRVASLGVGVLPDGGEPGRRRR